MDSISYSMNKDNGLDFKLLQSTNKNLWELYENFADIWLQYINQLQHQTKGTD